MKLLRYCAAAMLTGGLLASAGTAQAATKVKLEPLVSGVNTPLAMVQPAGDDRKFVIEQNGRIRIIDKDGNLTVSGQINVRHTELIRDSNVHFHVGI